MSDISRLIRRTFDKRAKTIGVTRQQWRVLSWLQRLEGINQSALADKLELDAMTLCRMVDRLAAAEMVERRADADDRRAWKLFLTPKGSALMHQLTPIAEQLLVEGMAGLAEKEQDQLTHLLERMHSNMQSIDNADSQEKRTVNG